MTIIRALMSLLIVAVMVLSVAGWRWTATHQPPAQALAAHVVLGLSLVAGIVGLAALWSLRRPSR
ncbi:MAG: hypothetical protein ABI634_03970 [Acidobacteriota bacterium]